MPRITRIWLVLLLGLWLPTGCAKPPAEPLNPPQKALAECLDLASEVAKHGFP